MSFRCLGNYSDEEYLRFYDDPSKELVTIRRLYHEKSKKLNKMHLANDKLRHKNQKLKKENEELRKSLRKQESDLVSLTKQTQTRIEKLHKENQHVQECFNKLKREQAASERMIKLLREQLASDDVMDKESQNEIVKPTESPKVQQILWKYNDLRDNTYSTTKNCLIKHIKAMKTFDFDTVHINQTCHEILFNILIECYAKIKTEKLKQRMINKAPNPIDLVLNGLKTKLMKYNDEEIVCNILDLEASNHLMIQIAHFVEKSVEICRLMVMREKELSFYPSVWNADPTGNSKFNPDIHERVSVSQKDCNNVLYYCWPIIISDNDIIGSQMIEVVTRNKFVNRKK